MSSDIDMLRRRTLEIFEQIVDLPAADRTARLDALCAGDDVVRARVEAMLKADTGEDATFPVLALSTMAGVAEAEAGHLLGRVFGAWRVVSVLGRGGMGAVYAVERADGAYAQLAALKLIRTAADSPAARERFLRERQLLAGLQHPNIATLLDGGFSDEGDPYFVMERVDGIPIDQWCDARRLDLRQRVQLFAQVLAAVSHAHRNLVIHRDLKPSNLLVDGEGRVKLLDFGIAKQLENSDATATGDRALTFEYASPEQLHAGTITTATDLWQLGVVLHRLLSGSHPFGLTRDTPLVKQLQLLEREPEPLTRAASQASVEQAALRGEADASALSKSLRGGLAAIVETCLRREPEARYASADALAADLQCWLEHRPVKAMQLGRHERARLWLRRNRLLAASIAAVTVALLAGTGVSLWQAREARLQTDNARQSLKFVVDTFTAAQPANARRKEISARELFDAARAQLDQNSAASPRTKQSLQRLLGHLYATVDENTTATALFKSGLENVQPRNRDEALALADDLSSYANALAAQERGTESLAAAQRAADLRQRHAAGDPLEQIEAEHDLGVGYYRTQDGAKAEQHWRKVLALAAGVAHPPQRTLQTVLNAHQTLASMLVADGRGQDAQAVMAQALAYADQHGLPADSPWRVQLLRSQSEVMSLLGDHADAEAAVRRAIALQSHAIRDDGSTNSKLYNQLGITLEMQGRYREAGEALARSRASAGSALDGTPQDNAITLANEASHRENMGDYAGAVAGFEGALAVLDQAGLSSTDSRAGIERNLARAMGFTERRAEAWARLQALREQARTRDGAASFNHAFLTWQLAVLASRQGDARRGLPLLEDAVASLGTMAPPQHPVFAHAQRARARFLQAQGDLPAAETAQREAITRLAPTANATDLAIARAELAAIRYAQGDNAGAHALLKESLPVLRNALLPGEFHRAAAEVLAKQLDLR